MKLIISFLLYSIYASAVGVELQFTNEYINFSTPIKSHISKHYNIPKSLIKTKTVSHCKEKLDSNKTIFCFENKKGPELLSDPKNINSLLVFGEFND
jgi:hypothetical protein